MNLNSTRSLEAELAALGGSLRTRSKRTRTIAISTWARSNSSSFVDLTHLGKVGVDNQNVFDRGGLGFLRESDNTSNYSSSSSPLITVYCPNDEQEIEKQQQQQMLSDQVNNKDRDTSKSLDGKVFARVDDAFEIVPGTILLNEMKKFGTERKLANKSSFPPLLASLGEGVLRAVDEPLTQWLNGFDATVLLIGQRGTGKSTVAFGAPALLPSGVINRSLFVGGNEEGIGGGVNGGYSNYTLGGGKGRPSLCGVFIDAALSHIRASKRAETLRTKRFTSTHTETHRGTSSSSSSSSSSSLCISMWSISCEDDTARDALNRFTPREGISSTTYTDFTPIKVSVETEEEARRVIAAGLVRCGNYEATRLPSSNSSSSTTTTTTSSSSPSSSSQGTMSSKLIEVLMPIPSLCHIFVSFELTSTLDTSYSSALRSGNGNRENIQSPFSSSIFNSIDPSTVGSVTRRTLTLVDLAGASTISAAHSGGGNPTLRVRAVELKSHAMLQSQMVSLERLIEEVTTAQRAAGYMMKSINPKQSQTSVTIRAQLAATRKRILFTKGQQSLYTESDENSSPPSHSSTSNLFRVDRDNNNLHGKGIGGIKKGSTSTNAKAAATLHIRDTLFARSLAPLLGAGDVLATVIGLLSSSRADEANNKSTLRFLASVGKIIAHAVRNDVLAPLIATRSIESDTSNGRQHDMKIIKLKRRVLPSNEWWEEHGIKITDIPTTTRPRTNEFLSEKSKTDHNNVNFDLDKSLLQQSHHETTLSSPLSPSIPPYAAAPSLAATAFGAAYKNELALHQALVGNALAVTEQREKRELEMELQQQALNAIDTLSEAANTDIYENEMKSRAPASRVIVSNLTQLSSSSTSLPSSSNIIDTPILSHSSQGSSIRPPLRASSVTTSKSIQTIPEPLTILQPVSVDWRPSYYELSKKALDGTLTGGTLRPKKTVADASISVQEYQIRQGDFDDNDNVKQGDFDDNDNVKEEEEANESIGEKNSNLRSTKKQTKSFGDHNGGDSMQFHTRQGQENSSNTLFNNSLNESSTTQAIKAFSTENKLKQKNSIDKTTNNKATSDSFLNPAITPSTLSTPASPTPTTASALSMSESSIARAVKRLSLVDTSLSMKRPPLSPSPSDKNKTSDKSIEKQSNKDLTTFSTTTLSMTRLENDQDLAKKAATLVPSSSTSSSRSLKSILANTPKSLVKAAAAFQPNSSKNASKQERDEAISKSIGSIDATNATDVVLLSSSTSQSAAEVANQLSRSAIDEESDDDLSVVGLVSTRSIDKKNLKNKNSTLSSSSYSSVSPALNRPLSQGATSTTSLQIASPTERSGSRTSIAASYLEHHLEVYYNEQPNTSSEEEEEINKKNIEEEVTENTNNDEEEEEEEEEMKKKTRNPNGAKKQARISKNILINGTTDTSNTRINDSINGNDDYIEEDDGYLSNHESYEEDREIIKRKERGLKEQKSTNTREREREDDVEDVNQYRGKGHSLLNNKNKKELAHTEKEFQQHGKKDRQTSITIDHDQEDSVLLTSPLSLPPSSPPHHNYQQQQYNNNTLLHTNVNLSGISSRTSVIVSPRTSSRFAALDRDLEIEERRVENELAANQNTLNTRRVIDGRRYRKSSQTGDKDVNVSKASLEANVDALSRRLASLSSEVADMTGRVQLVAATEKRGHGLFPSQNSIDRSVNEIAALSSTSSSLLSSSAPLSPPRAVMRDQTSAFLLPLSPALIRYSTSRFHAANFNNNNNSNSSLLSHTIGPVSSSTSLSESLLADMSSPSYARSAFSSIKDSPRSLLNAAAKARAFAASIRQRKN